MKLLILGQTIRHVGRQVIEGFGVPPAEGQYRCEIVLDRCFFVVANSTGRDLRNLTTMFNGYELACKDMIARVRSADRAAIDASLSLEEFTHRERQKQSNTLA